MADRSTPEDCAVGAPCMICFDEPDHSCIKVLYRGGGPPEGTFDFTPTYFIANCGRSQLPARFVATCSDLEAAVIRFGYDRRTNCVASPTDEGCTAILAEAERLKVSDSLERLACLAEGESAYNAR